MEPERNTETLSQKTERYLSDEPIIQPVREVPEVDPKRLELDEIEKAWKERKQETETILKTEIKPPMKPETREVEAKIEIVDIGTNDKDRLYDLIEVNLLKQINMALEQEDIDHEAYNLLIHSYKTMFIEPGYYCSNCGRQIEEE